MVIYRRDLTKESGAPVSETVRPIVVETKRHLHFSRGQVKSKSVGMKLNVELPAEAVLVAKD